LREGEGGSGPSFSRGRKVASLEERGIPNEKKESFGTEERGGENFDYRLGKGGNLSVLDGPTGRLV